MVFHSETTYFFFLMLKKLYFFVLRKASLSGVFKKGPPIIAQLLEAKFLMNEHYLRDFYVM